jgi:hypothetical protein
MGRALQQQDERRNNNRITNFTGMQETPLKM